MSKRYQVLARKYRPQTFRDVVGQQPAVTTLQNAIQFNQVAHGYLFCGSRGVGKTTLARLFAKALNCKQLTKDLEPCNICPSCQEIQSGQSLDVIEIDGASNRGIDDIRQINETVGYAPSHGKYKIYIIDEVHMLTKEAFNALLKTLEEPPESAKFFFATTESHKVLPTIISRCQRFDLARIPQSLIVEKLAQIAQDLSRTVEPQALELIASFSEGSLRDAESLFDQILCFVQETITSAAVRKSLGLVPQELFYNLDQAFSSYQLSYAFELVEQLFQTGKDLSHFFEQLIEHYRSLVLARTLNTPHPSAALYTQPQALFILDLLIQQESTFQRSVFQSISLESILLQIIRSKHRIPIEVLIRKITELSASGNLPDLTAPMPLPLPIEPALTLPMPELTPAPAPKPIPLPEPVLIVPAPSPEPIAVAPLPPPVLKEVPFNPFQAQLQPPAPIEQAPPYRNNLKNQEFGQEAAQVFAPGASDIAERQSASEGQKDAAKPTTPKTDSSGCFGIKHMSHYDTMIRFAAIELEGTVKK